MIHIGNDWDDLLAGEFEKPYYQKLRTFLAEEYRSGKVYPPMNSIFNALRNSSYENTKVVILGLVNIYKELERDMGIAPANHGCLSAWASQGVLLLNTVLTVRDSQPNSHKGKGWEIFTDQVISLLNEREKPMVFILWGANAKAKETLITNNRHLILTGAHPSPLSAYNGFFGGKYFSRANHFLELTGQQPIDWALE